MLLFSLLFFFFVFFFFFFFVILFVFFLFSSSSSSSSSFFSSYYSSYCSSYYSYYSSSSSYYYCYCYSSSYYYSHYSSSSSSLFSLSIFHLLSFPSSLSLCPSYFFRPNSSLFLCFFLSWFLFLLLCFQIPSSNLPFLKLMLLSFFGHFVVMFLLCFLFCCYWRSFGPQVMSCNKMVFFQKPLLSKMSKS